MKRMMIKPMMKSMMNSKKAAQEMWWIIIAAILAIIVLALLLVWFKGGGTKAFDVVNQQIGGLQDTDGDKVADTFDRCPNSGGEDVDSTGCPTPPQLATASTGP